MGAGGLMVEKIKEQVSLADVFRFYNLDLVRGKICCPFHNEKTPSLSVKGEIKPKAADASVPAGTKNMLNKG